MPCTCDTGHGQALRSQIVTLNAGGPPLRRGLRRLWQIDNAVLPIPCTTLILPKRCQQAGLKAVIRSPNHSAKENQSGVVLSGAKHLACVPHFSASFQTSCRAVALA